MSIEYAYPFTDHLFIWRDVPLRLSGTFYPHFPATRTEPSEGGYVEITNAYVKDVDITSLINENDWPEIENAVYQDIVEARQRDADDLRIERESDRSAW